VPEAARDEVREIVFQGYRIIYLIKPDCVFVASIVHGSRDLNRQANKPWEVG
jgi:plasmid stabilization system protein ParE